MGEEEVPGSEAPGGKLRKLLILNPRRRERRRRTPEGKGKGREK